MENLPGEDVIALRRAVPQILRVLATNDHTSKIWRTVRLAAGVPAAENGKERPSPTEFTQIRYVLETHCMVCTCRDDLTFNSHRSSQGLRGLQCIPAMGLWVPTLFGLPHSKVLVIVVSQYKCFLLTAFVSVAFRVTTLRDFIDEHSEFANNWGKLREGIPWVAAGECLMV